MGMVQMAGVGADEALAKYAAKYEIPVGVSTAASMSLKSTQNTQEDMRGFNSTTWQTM